ncbi:MAG: UTP--glucose-1-phosphate uridylyltransferase [Lachnospiraceae bacterium]|nr:UTP--glucose-1-phosphate uridylyltransferase [Lachnospiraceae bacterium]
MILDSVKTKLAKYGQEHLLMYFDELSESEKTALLDQIDNLDMSCLEENSLSKDTGEIAPIEIMELKEITEKSDEFKKVGLSIIKEGKAAALMLAGGMGTRLGSDSAKGKFDIGVTKELFIFECQMNNLMDVVNEAGAWIHLFIMTSDKNNDETIEFFKEKNYFGYNPEFVHFFVQEKSPTTDKNGKILLEDKGVVSTSPNGNGGWLISLRKSGLDSIIEKNNIEWINVFAVDNVLQKMCDPVFIGATVMANCSMGSKVVRKTDPNERVGVMCLEDGRPSIVEYYDLSDEMRYAKNDKGEYEYYFGVILNYIFKYDALCKVDKCEMPFHVVEKAITCLDENGVSTKSDKPNGYKYETLVLDMIKSMDSCLPFEVVREREFAPIKNRYGTDSVDTARELLKQNGIKI